MIFLNLLQPHITPYNSGTKDSLPQPILEVAAIRSIKEIALEIETAKSLNQDIVIFYVLKNSSTPGCLKPVRAFKKVYDPIIGETVSVEGFLTVIMKKK